jgi:hypothetical protein
VTLRRQTNGNIYNIMWMFSSDCSRFGFISNSDRCYSNNDKEILMKAVLQGDTGGFICPTLSHLSEGDAVIDEDGNLRLKIAHNSYLVRSRSGTITAHRTGDWPSNVVGKRVKVKLILEVTQ